MKLAEALNLVMRMRSRGGNLLPCCIAAGINPLHLKTFLTAELSLLCPDQTVEIREGIYGDLVGNVRRLSIGDDLEFGAVLIEWTDLDPRLGVRSAAKWSNSELSDILTTAKGRSSRLRQAIEEVGLHLPLTICFPSLPLPPYSFASSWQMSEFELDLRTIVQSLASDVCRLAGVGVLSSQSLDQQSPMAARLDIESDIRTGFPYSLSHASALAALLAQFAKRPVPKKGLITDLDDTLWRGILGEIGIGGISWDLEHGSQMHAFYQRFIGALASEGVLIGIASKNDHGLVEEALRRSDLALSPTMFFPVEARWTPKSQSVARILKTWNVGSESVVFIDDSPFELEEVNLAFPNIECVRFPTKDNTAIYNLTLHLRNLFGKRTVFEEDTIRLESIRRAHSDANVNAGASLTEPLDHTETEITFNSGKTPPDPRALELVNKTNQFNLNGQRYSEASWHRLLLDPNSFLLVASYRDKFGPLGKIAVIAGHRYKRKLTINTWVMSCRAFSRRVEYRCLVELIAQFDPEEIEFQYARTERNEPLHNFLGEILGTSPSPGCAVSRKMAEIRADASLNRQESING